MGQADHEEQGAGAERQAVRLATLDELVAAFPTGIVGRRIHAVGAGGSGVSAGLRLARAQGAIVSGCDNTQTSQARLLDAEGIPIVYQHDVAHVDAAELVVTNPAVTFLDANHPELAAAQARGIPVAQWQTLLGYLMCGRVGVSVAGVHGKGTTTALLGVLAIAGGLDPTVEVGAVVHDWGGNVRLGKSEYFINEADEFNYNFHDYHPRMVTLTEVEYDHPEFFPNYEAIRDAFVGFLRGMDTASHAGLSLPPTLILNGDSPGCRDTLAQLEAQCGEWPGELRTFRVAGARAPDSAPLFAQPADALATEVEVGATTSFTLHLRGERLGRVTLQIPGEHNVANAVAAAAGAHALGVAPAVILATLNGFTGLKRRFEVIEDGEVTFIDDYAHHPHAVALTLATARRRFPGRRLIGVFQPTLYTRLHRFLAPFAAALAEADVAVVVEIQPSRERDTGLLHGNDLVRAIAEQPGFAADQAYYGGDFPATAALLRRLRQPGDVIAVLGSGPVNQVIALARDPQP